MLPADRAPAYPTQYAGEPTFLCLGKDVTFHSKIIFSHLLKAILLSFLHHLAILDPKSDDGMDGWMEKKGKLILCVSLSL